MDYEVNYDTQVILPIEGSKSKVIESDNEYVVNQTVQEVLEHSCEYFGSSYEGRKEGTRKMLGITHKSPIIVEESQKMIFFPTTSPERLDCIWVNLEKIEKYYKVDNKKSAIIFKKGDKLEFDVSFGSLSNQILRATRLKFVLDERTSKKGN